MRYLTLIITLLTASVIFAQNHKEIHTKNGWHAEGEVIEHIEDEYYLIKTDYGKEFKIPIDDIEIIKNINSEGNEFGKIIDPDNNMKDSYLEVGVSGMSPGRYNINFGLTFGDNSLYLTGAPGVFEIAGAFKAAHSKNKSIEFMMPFGILLENDARSQYYTGILMKFWFYGLQIVPGYVLPFNTTEKNSQFYNYKGPKNLEPTFYLQAGFVYRFN